MQTSEKTPARKGIDPGAIELRKPDATDGASVHQLVGSCPPLDTNSMYCNLLQCSHFAGTCVAAVLAGNLVGFVSAYLIPDRPRTLFVWQVVVAAEARGCGLASSMLEELLRRPACRDIDRLETTITASNRSSWALFERLSRNIKAELSRSVMFDHDRHFRKSHDTELLVSIGPLSP